MDFFHGTAIRDEILLDLRKKVIDGGKDITLAVILASNNPVCEKYVELKQKVAEKLGVHFAVYKFGEGDSEKDVLDCIKFLNSDAETTGIMIQIPTLDKFDRDALISAIDPAKDVDGLRYCLGLDSDFRPPVVLSILEAVKRSGKDIENSKILVVGKGFLVGSPLIRVLKEKAKYLNIADAKTPNLAELVGQADIIVSAVGKPGIIQADMIKPGVVLIDAGTTEQNGTLLGDIDPVAFKDASYFTPVPGGIGPVTVAMLFRNLISCK